MSRTSWEAETPKLRPGILEALRRDAERLAGDRRDILFCFTSDPYQPELWQHTSEALAICAAHNLRPSILTKSVRVRNDLSYLAQIEGKLGVTMVFSRDRDRRAWEPGAASVKARIDLLADAHARGIYTWVSLEPVIDPAQRLELIGTLSRHVNHWKVGMLNNTPDISSTIDWLQFRANVQAKFAEFGITDYYLKRDLRKRTCKGNERS